MFEITWRFMLTHIGRISLLLVVDRHKLTVFYLKSFDMDSVQVGKAVFGKEIHTTLGIEPRTILQSGEVRQPF